MTTRTQQFPVDPELTAIVLAYKNLDAVMIGDQVLPPFPVGKIHYRYFEYPEDMFFRLPETAVSKRGAFNRLEFVGDQKDGSVLDDGIEVPLSNDDINEAPASLNVKGQAAALAMNVVLLRSEVDVARMVTDATRYPDASKDALSGSSQFTHADSDPLKYLRGKLKGMIVRANAIAMGPDVWEAIATHPKVVSAALGNEGTTGVATRERVAQLLEVNEINVGAAWLNTAKPGEAMSLERVWGPDLLMYYRDRSVGPLGGLTFGYQTTFGTRQAGWKPDGDMGVRGGVVVRAWKSTRSHIIAPRAAVLVKNAVAT